MSKRPRRNHGSAFKAKVDFEAFKESASKKDKAVAKDSTVKVLHTKIGQLAMENDFLSVEVGRIGDSSAKK